MRGYYVHGQKPYTCRDCGDAIPQGVRHLVCNRSGWFRICERCSVLLNADGSRRYDCYAVEQRLARAARAVERRAKYPKPLNPKG